MAHCSPSAVRRLVWMPACSTKQESAHAPYVVIPLHEQHVLPTHAIPPVCRVRSHVALKPLVKKQLSAWRPITARLNLLRKLVSEFGMDGGSGLATEGVMGFIQVSRLSRLRCPARHTAARRTYVSRSFTVSPTIR